MSTILESIEPVFSHVLGWMADVTEFVTGQPLLLIGLGLMLAGAAVGFISRLIHTF